MIKRSFYIAVGCFIALASCKDSKNGFEEGYESAQNDAQEATAKKMQKALKLYVFDGGSVRANDKNLFSENEVQEKESLLLADAFYVIKHPQGILLWDTGLPEKLVGKKPHTSPDGAFTLSRQDSILKQLKSVGINPADVKYIAFSQMHFDHTGAANNFPDATWLVQKTSLDFLNSDAPKEDWFYDLSSFENLNKKQVLNGDYDVFNDGKVVIKHFPGHTAENQGLFLDLAKMGPVMISSGMSHPGQNSRDSLKSKESMEAFKDFIKQKKAKVLIQHDMEDFKRTTKAPELIE